MIKDMIRKVKRAFTITELVIVIAVIAILAAVLIPTLSSVISSSKTAADKAYVKEMNQTLSSYITLQLGGVAPTEYQDLMEALDSEGLCDASNPYLLAKELETEDAYVVWYPGTSSVVLILPDDGYTVTYSSVYGLGNGVSVTDTAGTVGYGIRLCTSTTDSEVLVADLYNELYGVNDGDVAALVKSATYTTAWNKINNVDATWASVIKSALANVKVGYSSSSSVKTAITTAVTTSSTATLTYTKEALLAEAGYTLNGDGSYTSADGTVYSANDIEETASQLVSSNVLTALATMSTLASDTDSSSALSGKTISIEVDSGTVVDVSEVTLTAIGTSYRKDDDFKTSTTQSFSIDFGNLTLSGYTVEKNGFTSTGANYQDAADLGNTSGGYAFTYGILGSVNGGTTAANTVTYKNLTITDINIDLNGSTESIDGTTYETLCDMAGVVCGFTYGYVSFENITIDGAGTNSAQGTFSGYDAVAGIVGRCYKNQTTGTGGVTLSNCSVSNLAITGQRRAGGLIGYTQGLDALTIDNCSLSNVDVVCSRNDGITQVMGGAIGHISTDLVIKNTLAISDVTTSISYGNNNTSSPVYTTPTKNLMYANYGSNSFIFVYADNDKNVSLYDASAKVTIDSSYTWAYGSTNSYACSSNIVNINFS